MEKGINLDPFLKNNTTKIMNQLTGKESKATFYVVTRNGRRAWPKNYWTISEAQNHATKLVASLKKYNDSDAQKVVIMETQDPDSIN